MSNINNIHGRINARANIYNHSLTQYGKKVNTFAGSFFLNGTPKYMSLQIYSSFRRFCKQVYN